MLMEENILNVDFDKYWYVLHSIGFHYPRNPNKVSKKKYYDLVMNIPIFMPSERLSNEFSQLLDKYPVTPYLDSRESFIKWTHFIHNRMNDSLGLKSIDYVDFIAKYTESSEKKELKKKHQTLLTKNLIIIASLVSIIIFVIYNRYTL